MVKMNGADLLSSLLLFIWHKMTRKRHFLICLLSWNVIMINSYVFEPSLDPNCAKSLTEIVLNLDPTNCGPIIDGILNTDSELKTCTAPTNVGYPSCFNENNVVSLGQTSHYYVPVYKIPTTPSQCPVCTPSSGMIEGCSQLFATMSDVIYKIPIDYASYNITNTTLIVQTDIYAQEAAHICLKPELQATVQILQYQTEVLCASTNTFNMTVDATSGNIENIVDMRSVLQCGQCAVIQCSLGQLCNGDGNAKMCPQGSYCPIPMIEIICPDGYFCPQGSVSAVQCSKLASYSCPEGSHRQVVWIPLMIAFLVIGAVLVLVHFQDVMKRRIGYMLTYKNRGGAGYRKVVSAEKERDSLLSYALAKTAPISISFSDITLVTGKTVRISGVTGHIRPGKFTAILGGSGAGKTSLMNVILGREARTTGAVAYTSPNYKDNKYPIPCATLDRIVAFVPQNDVYLREMTVYELVLHSACSRLPSSLGREEILQRVEDVLSQLQLQALRDVTVGSLGGSGGSSSLSPGDRKMVNIALELVSGPNILFLDEPTTGIDASSALNVARIVANLAHTGLTCVAVIHQPRAEIFSLIDDMIILVRGGKVAYQGPAQYVMDYFALHGCSPSSPTVNKTDFLIDVTSAPPKPMNNHSIFSHSTDDFMPIRSDSGRSTIVTMNAAHNPNRYKTSFPPSDGATGGSSYPHSQEQGMGLLEGEESESDQETVSRRGTDDTKDSFRPYIVGESGSTGSRAASSSSAVSGGITWWELWDRDGEAFLESMSKEYNLNSTQYDRADTHSISIDDVNNSTALLNSAPIDVPRPGFFPQLYLYCYRGVLQHVKNNILLSDMLISLVGGVILGIVTCGGPLVVNAIPGVYTGSCPPGAEEKCNEWIRFEIGPATFLIAMIVGSILVPFAIRTFGREKEVFAREASTGANKAAYYLGKMLSDLPFMAVNVFCFMAPMIAIAQWRSPVDKMYGVLLCLAIVVMSMGYFLAFVFNDPDSAVLTGVILAVLLNLFSGFVPTIGDGPIGQVMYTHWFARAITTAELYYGQGISNDNYQYDSIVPEEWATPDLSDDCNNMLLIALILQVVAFATMLFKNRRVSSF